MQTILLPVPNGYGLCRDGIVMPRKGP